jgi:glycosyltransferase involved in cell wall biosynthesis
MAATAGVHRFEVSEAAAADSTPLVSVVVPTKEEAENIAPLLERLSTVARTCEIEVIFVDDSDDETPESIREVGSEFDASVSVIHRPAGERAGGLATAVIAGFEAARGSWICVMDADLQHPPEVITQLLGRAKEGDVDMVVASRFVNGGSADDFGPLRSFLSHFSSGVARIGFRRALKGVSDPMSGFFLVSRAAVAANLTRLRPRGFKILLELLVRVPELRKAEVGFVFGERFAGKSKASVGEAINYFLHLWRLRLTGATGRFIKFGLVGLSGLAVNTGVLALLTEAGGLYYLLAAVIATQFSTTWNFVLAERLVFKPSAEDRRLTSRFLQFLAVNNALLLLRGPILVLFTSGLHVQYLVSNVFTLTALTLARFGVADTWIWARPKAAAGRSLYDVHGLVSVASDVPLPELERFGVPQLAGTPDIDVKIGTVAPDKGRKKTVEITRDRLVYDEGLGSYGFAIDVRAGERIDVKASRLLRRSPHVLYTNVVEPILRWHFAARGYALVHAACMSSGDKAFLITARTDTGKTTTILKSLDANPGLGFLSDDLTLLCPDGSVLTYPKPLTISRHTVAAVKAPLLSRRERLALVFQSRLHSKSGRAFAFFLSKHNLPVATINAIVQLLVPPPKYHVDRLVPGVVRTREAQYEELVVIQRGDDFSLPLEADEAVAIILENCADAYGFPPYTHLEQFLHERSDLDLVAAESALIRATIERRPATLLSSSSRNWYLSLPEIFSLPATEPEAGRDQTDLADHLRGVLPTPAPIPIPEPE